MVSKLPNIQRARRVATGLTKTLQNYPVTSTIFFDDGVKDLTVEGGKIGVVSLDYGLHQIRLLCCIIKA